jgi:hypothetical protein
MGFGSRAFLAGGLGFAASFVVACGGGNGLLTSNDANNLNSRLDRLSAAVASGHCGAAASAAQNFDDAVSRLPSTVSATLVRNLGQGAQTVQQLAARDCRNNTTTATTTSSSTTSSTTSSPTTTVTPSSSSTTSSSSSATVPSGPGTSSTATNGGAGVGGGGGNGGTTPSGQ